jgi:hypothetical protein
MLARVVARQKQTAQQQGSQVEVERGRLRKQQQRRQHRSKLAQQLTKELQDKHRHSSQARHHKLESLQPVRQLRPQQLVLWCQGQEARQQV